MANADAQILGNLSQFTECSICMDTLKKPKALPCIHTFCLECLQKYGEDISDGDSMSCPMCRNMFYIPKGGFEKLPTNFFIQELLENKKEVRSTDSQLMCDMCCSESVYERHSTPVNKYCVNCDQNMCEKCVLIHSKMRATLSHKVVSSIDKQSGVLVRHRPTFCEKHQDKSLEFYCYDCNRCICSLCKATEHEGHYSDEATKASKKFITELKLYLPVFRIIKLASEENLKKMETFKEDFLLQISKAGDEISETVEFVISAVSKHRDQLIKKLDRMKTKRLKEMQIRKDEVQLQLVANESFEKYVKELIEHRSACDILRSANDLRTRCKEFNDSGFAERRLVKDKVAFVKDDTSVLVQTLTQSVGHIVHNGLIESVLLNRVQVSHVMPHNGSTVQGMATLHSQLFTVRHGSQRLDIYNTLDYTQTGHKTVRGLKSPSSLVACPHHNCLYVSDYVTSDIHRVDLLDRAAVSKWVVLSNPSGLSLTRSHHLLVTLCMTKSLCEYTTHGDLVRTISLDYSIANPCHAVELSTGQLVVCHATNTQHRVCMIDTEGRIVRSYGAQSGSGAGQLLGPRCLAVDASDHVFVTDYSNNRLRLLGPSLEFLTDVSVPGHKAQGPYRIHLDQGCSQLYISENTFGGGRLFVLSATSDSSQLEY